MQNFVYALSTVNWRRVAMGVMVLGLAFVSLACAM